MFRFGALLTFAAACCGLAASDGVRWDKNNDFQPWRACWRLKCGRGNGVLKLTDIGTDSSIITLFSGMVN